MPRPAPPVSRRTKAARKPSPAPVLATVVLFAAGIALIARLRMEAQAEEAAPSAPEHVPFADYHEPRGPRPEGAVAPERGLARPSRIQGSGPTSDAVWVEAWDVAEQAYGLLDQANAARERQDHAQYQEQGKLAKEAFDRALMMTAEWEEELLATRGEADPEVRRILATRSDWFDKLRVLHKTTGR